MTSPLVIREAETSDYESIANLTMAAYKPLFEGVGLPEDLGWYGAELRDVAGRASRAMIVVAEIDHQIVGSLA